MSYQPTRCPFSACVSHTGRPFLWTRKGLFARRCDGRLVQRFLCRACGRTFSLQSFRVDYRLKKPRLHLTLFRGFVSKLTIRQSARLYGCSKKTVTHRLALLAEHCREIHLRFLARAAVDGGRFGVFALDELETFEHSRLLAPLTVPILIERESGFVVHAESATLPCRGRLRPAMRAKKLAREKVLGKRRSGSREAVERCFAVLERILPGSGAVHVHTDRKTSYASLLRKRFGERLRHVRISSKLVRNKHNPLFMINHTCALVRDALSRLVRRNWAHSKRRAWLDRHLWIWLAYRNYLRGKINKQPNITPAMKLGLAAKRFRLNEFFAVHGRFQHALQAQ
ncbi:MAG: hypothetical protein ACKVWV_15835 [Planctomycetota bacterium]